MAQQKPDHFLADVFAFNSFKINSTLQEVQNDKHVAENLSFRFKFDNKASYYVIGQPINLPGLKSLDRLAFDTLELTFENNKLHDILLFVPNPFKDNIFKKTCDQFNSKYGQAVIVDQKKNKSKKYVWDLGTNKLTLSSYPDMLAIHYASKISNKEIGWVYNDRKGKGNGTLQLNLACLEKLLGQKLTTSSFEKILPQWETTGMFNHVDYDLNFRTLNHDRLIFSITYSLNDYDLAIRTVDTTSKVINEFKLDKIKDTNVWSQFEKDLVNLNYIMGPKLKYSTIVTYSNHKYFVFLNKEESSISIKNEFKLKLP